LKDVMREFLNPDEWERIFGPKRILHRLHAVLRPRLGPRR
jgi:hypothetical protein